MRRWPSTGALSALVHQQERCVRARWRRLSHVRCNRCCAAMFALRPGAMLAPCWRHAVRYHLVCPACHVAVCIARPSSNPQVADWRHDRFRRAAAVSREPGGIHRGPARLQRRDAGSAADGAGGRAREREGMDAAAAAHLLSAGALGVRSDAAASWRVHSCGQGSALVQAEGTCAQLGCLQAAAG